MIKVGDVLVSDEALEARFACDLGCCRGACCRVGDIGAPLADGEREAVLLALPALVESAPATSRSRIRSGDVFDRFFEKTHLACHPEGPCVLSFPGPDGTLGCQLERAWRAGKTRFPKPRFCHLFPLVLESFYGQTVLNLERRPECEPGFVSSTGLLEFSREPLIRLLGAAWYDELEQALPGARAELAARPRRRTGSPP